MNSNLIITIARQYGCAGRHIGEELAKKLHYTRNHLYKLFKKEYGVSPSEYMMALRIEKAKMLFHDQTKTLSVSNVAYAVGFADPLYFSRIFRQRTGASPTEFKNNPTPL